MWLIRLEPILVSVAWNDQEYFYSPLNGMQAHGRATPCIKFTATNLHTWVERGTVRVNVLPKSTTQCRSGVKRTNYNATTMVKYKTNTWLSILVNWSISIWFEHPHKMHLSRNSSIAWFLPLTGLAIDIPLPVWPMSVDIYNIYRYLNYMSVGTQLGIQ